MSKAYLLVICLLAASFTGCLGSDDTEEEIPVEEEETIEPVGTDDSGDNETNYYNETNHYHYNNDTYYVNGTDYLELISQVENLTAEVEELTGVVEELTEAIEEMQSSKYDVPENSSILITNNIYNDNRSFEIIKNGSIITIEYRGDIVNMYVQEDSPRNCTTFTPGLVFYREDGVQISNFYPGDNLWNDGDADDPDRKGREYWRHDVEIIRECSLVENAPDTQRIEQFWSTIIITLPEEPVRVDTGAGYYTFN